MASSRLFSSLPTYEITLRAQATVEASPIRQFNVPDSPLNVDHADAAPPGPAGRLLYIEDNLVNQLVVQELVAQRPHLQLVCEGDGASGLVRALAMQPELILLDMQLPDMDGYQVLRGLRADARTCAIPCIALSANAMPEDIQQARKLGFTDYWTKPIDFKTFLAGLDARFPPKP
jgi:CheY-like chemotaxis protein